MEALMWAGILVGLVIGLTIHEAAHALTARLLGDHIAWSYGRASLNPLRHLTFWGTAAVFVLGFGWARPVPINPYHFRRPKLDMLLTSLAGPVSNLLLAGLCVVVLAFVRLPQPLALLVMNVMFINGILATINLIPIPPLDGSRIWPCLLPGAPVEIPARWSLIGLAVLLISMYTGLLGWGLRSVMKFGARMTATPQVMEACRYVVRPTHLPAVLEPPTGAHNVRYHCSLSDNDAGHYDWMGCSIEAQYPSADALTPIYGRLREAGFARHAARSNTETERDGKWRPENVKGRWAAFDRTEQWNGGAAHWVVIQCRACLKEDCGLMDPTYHVAMWYYYDASTEPDRIADDFLEGAADPNGAAGGKAGSG